MPGPVVIKAARGGSSLQRHRCIHRRIYIGFDIAGDTIVLVVKNEFGDVVLSIPVPLPVIIERPKSTLAYPAIAIPKEFPLAVTLSIDTPRPPEIPLEPAIPVMRLLLATLLDMATAVRPLEFGSAAIP